MTSSLGQSVRKAVLWRSGSQMLAQLVAWGSTLAVIRILDPSDYGLFAMTQVVLAFLGFLNGYGFASALVQDRDISRHKIRQAFGMLVLINGALALLQFACAPLAAAWYRQPLIADLLQVQALIFLAMPFIAVPEILLVREMDFRRPAIVNIAATVISAGVAIGCALAGYGVWTLVYAPLAMFWTRGIGLMIAARFLPVPSFDFSGAGGMFRFGMLMLGSQFFWTVITQADVLIAARTVDAHQLGLYAEALFFTTIITSKFVPPLNQVAFPAYAKLQNDLPALSAAFLKALRMVLLLTCPLYFGLAVLAEDAVVLVLGVKWAAMAPLVTILALAMPAMTLHIMIGPVLNALDRAADTLHASLIGALIMPAAFLTGTRWLGIEGLAWAWLLAFPLVPAFAIHRARAPLGLSTSQFAGALAPALGASLAMALPVRALGQALADWDLWARLLVQIGAGGLLYLAVLYLVSRPALIELAALVASRKPDHSALTA